MTRPPPMKNMATTYNTQQHITTQKECAQCLCNTHQGWDETPYKTKKCHIDHRSKSLSHMKTMHSIIGKWVGSPSPMQYTKSSGVAWSVLYTPYYLNRNICCSVNCLQSNMSTRDLSQREHFKVITYGGVVNILRYVFKVLTIGSIVS